MTYVSDEQNQGGYPFVWAARLVYYVAEADERIVYRPPGGRRGLDSVNDIQDRAGKVLGPVLSPKPSSVRTTHVPNIKFLRTRVCAKQD